MPLSVPARYRMKRLSSGKMIRLAFRKGTNRVIEVARMRKGKRAKVLRLAKGVIKT